jgi:hypothetical protein
MSFILTKLSIKKKPDKVADFKRALQAGDCTLPDNLSQKYLDRLKALDIAIDVPPKELVH